MSIKDLGLPILRLCEKILDRGPPLAGERDRHCEPLARAHRLDVVRVLAPRREEHEAADGGPHGGDALVGAAPQESQAAAVRMSAPALLR